MHERIRNDAQSVQPLRALFLKLASVLDVPLVRITQAGSRDTASVAHYYSGVSEPPLCRPLCTEAHPRLLRYACAVQELVAFLRTVMEVIPVIVFGILRSVISLQASFWMGWGEW
jgi:WASH complex subunit strumpellin